MRDAMIRLLDPRSALPATPVGPLCCSPAALGFAQLRRPHVPPLHLGRAEPSTPPASQWVIARASARLPERVGCAYLGRHLPVVRHSLCLSSTAATAMMAIALRGEWPQICALARGDPRTAAARQHSSRSTNLENFSRSYCQTKMEAKSRWRKIQNGRVHAVGKVDCRRL